jgi:hypothetical protein
MKRLFASLFLIIFAISMSVTEHFLVKNTFDRVYDSIKISETKFSAGLVVTDEINIIFEKWEKSQPLLGIFIDHDSLDKLTEGFEGLKYTPNDKFLFETAKLKYNLSSVAKQEKINIEGLF